MACHVCGRTDVKKRPRAGKQHYPHKCPHGVWCVAGHRLLGSHANNVPIAGPGRCEACNRRLKEIDRARADARRAYFEGYRDGIDDSFGPGGMHIDPDEEDHDAKP